MHMYNDETVLKMMNLEVVMWMIRDPVRKGKDMNLYLLVLSFKILLRFEYSCVVSNSQWITRAIPRKIYHQTDLSMVPTLIMLKLIKPRR